ncbi:hypothetical protein DFAR_3210007 [Desulfarculales bacterium]
MQTMVLILVNALMLGLFAYMLTRKGLLAIFSGDRAWLTWLVVAIITIMDEFPPVFCAPTEAYRFLRVSYRFAYRSQGLFASIVALLKLVQYELTHWKVKVHFGRPKSDWLDRLSNGVMILNPMRLPSLFPAFHFTREYPGRVLGAVAIITLADLRLPPDIRLLGSCQPA